MTPKFNIKSGFVGIVGFTVCLLMIYPSYSGVLSFINNQIVPAPRAARFETQSGNEPFVYSNKDIYTTILGVKDTLCPEFKKRTKKLACAKTRRCDAANKGSKKLPRGCQQRLPGSIIIGVYKAGTRELIDFLAMHPGIVIRRQPFYEISFFCSSRYSRGLQWYREEMPYSMDDQITIEKSPGYFSHSLVPQRIRQMNPQIKLILMVRDPVHRTISHFTFSNPNTTAEDIKEVVNKRAQGHGDTSLLRYSIYDEPFEKYLRYFDRSQIHVVDSDKFKHDPYRVLFDIETFLGLPHAIRKDDFVFNHQKGFYCLKNPGGTFSACFGDMRGRKALKNDMETVRPLLRDVFEPHNRRFSHLTGQTFQWT